MIDAVSHTYLSLNIRTTREAISLVFLFVVKVFISFAFVSEAVFVKMRSCQRKARAKRRAEYLQKREEILKELSSEERKEKARERYHRNPEPKPTAEEERYHQNSDQKQTAEWGKYHKNPEPILSLKRQRYNEAMNSAEHRDDSIASPTKRMRLQERPTDQHAARSKCYRKLRIMGLERYLPINPKGTYVRIRLSDTIRILNMYMHACMYYKIMFINLCVAKSTWT